MKQEWVSRIGKLVKKQVKTTKEIIFFINNICIGGPAEAMKLASIAKDYGVTNNKYLGFLIQEHLNGNIDLPKSTVLKYIKKYGDGFPKSMKGIE